MSIVRAPVVLRSFGRMARTSELHARGVRNAELARAVHTGEILRPRQGVYALADTPETWLHAASHGGTVGCAAAATAHGLWVLAAPTERHIWMGAAGTPRSECRECVLHWDEGHVQVGEPAPVANALLQLATCCGTECFFAALESALRQSLLSPGGFLWLRRHVPRSMRWLLAFARADADSGLESIVRLRLHLLGIITKTQVSIRQVGEVDFVIGDRLIIEADGRQNHERERERDKDLRRDAAAAAAGYTTLRFSYALILDDWALVIAAIRGAITRGAHLASKS